MNELNEGVDDTMVSTVGVSLTSMASGSSTVICSTYAGFPLRLLFLPPSLE